METQAQTICRTLFGERTAVRLLCPSASCFMLCASFFMLRASYIIHHTSYIIPHTSYLVPHTSYLIPHTPYPIPHASYLIPHTMPDASHLTPHASQPHALHVLFSPTQLSPTQLRARFLSMGGCFGNNLSVPLRQTELGEGYQSHLPASSAPSNAR